jgi:hypothetical protein
VTLSRRVAEQLLGPCREALRALEAELGREVEIRVKPDLHQEQFEIRATGEAAPVKLELPWLRERREVKPEAAEPEPDADLDTEPDPEPELDAAPEPSPGPEAEPVGADAADAPDLEEAAAAPPAALSAAALGAAPAGRAAFAAPSAVDAAGESTILPGSDREEP